MTAGTPQLDPVKPQVKAESEHQMRMQLWQAAYKLALGPVTDRAHALETISLLVTVLQQINQKPEQKETK